MKQPGYGFSHESTAVVQPALRVLDVQVEKTVPPSSAKARADERL